MIEVYLHREKAGMINCEIVFKVDFEQSTKWILSLSILVKEILFQMSRGIINISSLHLEVRKSAYKFKVICYCMQSVVPFDGVALCGFTVGVILAFHFCICDDTFHFQYS